MRYAVILLLALLLSCGFPAHATHKYSGLPRTEAELMNSVLTCLRYKDSISYYALFPTFDTLWRMVLHNDDHTPETQKELNNLREHPQTLIDFDPYYNHAIVGRFAAMLQKGEDSGIHWNSIVLQRYELQKDGLTRDLAGYEKIAPERFSGYIFVRDLLGRSTFCITITEIQKINGYFFGGQVLNILEAATIDEFKSKEHDEQRYYWKLANDTAKKEAITDTDKVTDSYTLKKAADTTARDTDLLLVSAQPDDEEKQNVRREVTDQKYYEGKFDDEIPVKLFVRYMKDPKTGKAGFWDGLYKFGDQKSYVKLNIKKNADGVWLMEDDPPVGTMELELKNKIYTGTWTSNGNQSGYDVVLTQTDLIPKKVEELDNILDKGLGGSANQKSYQEGDEKPKPRQEDGFDPNEQ